MIKQCTEFVKRIAHLELEFNTDGEPTMTALADAVKRDLVLDNVTVHCTTAPRYSSQTLGAVGACQSMLQRQTRVIRLDVEERYQCTLEVAHEAFPWLTRHAAWTLERFHVRANGQTAYEDCFGTAYHGPVMKFLECAVFRHPTDSGGNATLGRKLSLIHI